ncbi:multicopper oxidase domain-containing protein [Leifsonella bigeumensis]|uniref:multicopper oxidase domain-containing protein n=1 Tax=Leifsonella bigeumensis TaxID=433643 RepID=UPI003CD07E6F
MSARPKTSARGNFRRGFVAPGTSFRWSPSGPFDAGWKDTIDLRPAEEVAIAIRFDGYAGKYVFHCHNLEHEDMAMMANFTTR